MINDSVWHKTMPCSNIEFGMDVIMQSYKSIMKEMWDEPIERPDYDHGRSTGGKTHIESAFERARQKLQEK